MRMLRSTLLPIATIGLLALALGEESASAAVSCTTEQNGKSGKITCTSCPGTKDDFTDAFSSDSTVVEVKSIVKSNETIGGAACGKMIVTVEKKKVGTANVVIEVNGAQVESIGYDIRSLSVSIFVPGGVNYGQVDSSLLLPGQVVTVSLKTIDTVTGNHNTLASGSATAHLVGASGITFDNGTQTRPIQFSGGLASLGVVGGALGDAAFLEIVDDSSPQSVGGTDILHTARIILQIVNVVPTLSAWGVVILAATLLIGALLIIMKRRRLGIPVG